MGGKSGGGGGTQNVQQVSEPWTGQQPYLYSLYSQAEGLPTQQPYPFPGFVPWSPASLGAMQATQQRALQGSPLLPAAQMQNLATTTGQYLYGGPGFNAAFDAASRRIMPQIAGQFERAGRYGGGLQQAEIARQLGDVFAGQYGQERARQMQATAMAPALAQADYADIARLGGVGAMQEAKAGEALADAMSRYQFQQEAPYRQLTAKSGVIQAGYPGGYMTGYQPTMRTSPLASALGGGLAGYGIGGPWGAGLGALAGLLA